jgi:sugar phosphate isomerase/epimerase
MKTCFSTLGCPEWSLAEIVSVASDLGYNGIEFRGVQNEMYTPHIDAFSPAHAQATRRRFEQLSLEIPCLASSCNLNDDSDVDKAKAYVDTASLVGAQYIRLLGDLNPAPSEDVSLKMVLANLLEIADYAKDKNVTPLIETNGFFAKTKALGTLFRKELAGENVGILYDIHHPYRFFNEDPAYTIDNIAPFVRHVHLKDSVMEGKKVCYRMLGEGNIPVAETVRRLNMAGYKGFYSLEWVKRWDLSLEEPGIAFAHYKNFMDALE